MTFWCIFRSPLMLGGNLPDNRPLEEKFFSNEEVLEVNQHGESPHQLYKDSVSMIWVSKAPKGSQSYYIALFNIGETDRAISVDFSKVGLRGKVHVRDLWKKADAGVFTKKYTTMIAAHGAVLIKAATQAQ
jgi:alpha-galactosidase